METKYIVDINKHGIRRERPAVGYKAVIKLNKKKKKKKKIVDITNKNII